MKKKKQKIAENINALDALGSSVASANECTGMIPNGDDTQTAQEFYNEMIDFLPHGVIPDDKYRDEPQA